MANQKYYEAKIVPSTGGSGITVKVPANDTSQAKKIIEQQYGPVKSWLSYPKEVK